MTSRLGRIALVLVFAFAQRLLAQSPTPATLGSTVSESVGSTEEVPNPGADKIRGWIKDLDSTKYLERRDATDFLIASQGHCVKSLEQALSKRCSVEVETRALAILGRIAALQNSSKNEAVTAMKRLAKAPQDRLARRASMAITPVLQHYKIAAIKHLIDKGAKPESFFTRISFNPAFQNQVKPSVVSRLTFDDNWKGSAKDLERLGDLFDLVEIAFVGEKITDDFLKPLAQLKSLQAVAIINAKVTDNGIQSLAQLPLVYLTVRYTPISDKSIETFRTLNKLRRLQLFGTDVKAEPEQLRAIFTATEVDHRKGGFLGVGPSLNPGVVNGCRINGPQENSAAAEQDFRKDDVITKYNNKPVTDFESLRALIAENRVGDKIPVELKRGNEILKKTVTLREWPPVP